LVRISVSKTSRGECAGLPGKYARPEGVVLLGRTASEAVGIVAYRPFEHGICEMKRLYVLPRFRGTGLGRLLVEELVRDDRSHGYRRMVLDTLPSMPPAQAVYSATGFQPIPAYYDNPLPGVIYIALEL
jgi:putative acetyltransferase